jgi:hypothetical protein
MDPSGNAIFCDDIREEVAGKFSLIGCYAGDMQFTNVVFPIGIPKLAIFVLARLPPREIPPLQLLVYFPGDVDDAPGVKMDISPIPWEEGPGVPEADLERTPLLRYSLMITPALFREPGFVRVRLMYGQQRVRLGALKVYSITSEPSGSAA